MRALIIFLSFILSVSAANAGEVILYSSFTDGYWQIWSMSPDGENKKQITFSTIDKREPDWVPAEEKIIYGTHNGEIYLTDLDGKQEQRILSNFAHVSDLRYSPSDRQLYFVVMNNTLPEAAQIWKSDVKGEEQVVLTRGPYAKYQPSISPDGFRIVYVKADPQNASHTLWMMKADGAEDKQISFRKGKESSPDISADGNLVIFAGNSDNDYDIYELDINKGTETRIVKDPGLDTSPRFSPDGRSIIFVSSRSGAQQIWSADQEGSAFKQLTDGNESVDPQWADITDKDKKP